MGGFNDYDSKRICILAIVGIVVCIRADYTDGGVLQSGSGARKNGVSRGVESTYDGTYKGM